MSKKNARRRAGQNNVIELQNIYTEIILQKQR